MMSYHANNGPALGGMGGSIMRVASRSKEAKRKRTEQEEDIKDKEIIQKQQEVTEELKQKRRNEAAVSAELATQERMYDFAYGTGRKDVLSELWKLKNSKIYKWPRSVCTVS